MISILRKWSVLYRLPTFSRCCNVQELFAASSMQLGCVASGLLEQIWGVLWVCVACLVMYVTWNTHFVITLGLLHTHACQLAMSQFAEVELVSSLQADYDPVWH